MFPSSPYPATCFSTAALWCGCGTPCLSGKQRIFDQIPESRNLLTTSPLATHPTILPVAMPFPATLASAQHGGLSRRIKILPIPSAEFFSHDEASLKEFSRPVPRLQKPFWSMERIIAGNAPLEWKDANRTRTATR
jgi:hypothetical protein